MLDINVVQGTHIQCSRWRTQKSQFRIENTCEFYRMAAKEFFVVYYYCFVLFTIAILFSMIFIFFCFTQFCTFRWSPQNTFNCIQCSEYRRKYWIILTTHFQFFFLFSHSFTSAECQIAHYKTQWVVCAPRFLVLLTLWLTLVD